MTKNQLLGKIGANMTQVTNAIVAVEIKCLLKLACQPDTPRRSAPPLFIEGNQASATEALDEAGTMQLGAILPDRHLSERWSPISRPATGVGVETGAHLLHSSR